MAESINTRERLDALVEEYVKVERSKKVTKEVDFYQGIAENGAKGAFRRSILVPGTGHFVLGRWLEGFCFLFLEIILTGFILWFLVKSVIAIFTSDPHRWRAFLWCLCGSLVYRAVTFVRVALLVSRIKSDAAYIMLRLADKKAAASK